MSIATLVYNATPNRLGSLDIDCTVSETHTADNDVTEHPVEGSASISDHIRPKQLQVTLTGLFTGTRAPTGAPGTVEHTTPAGDKVSLLSSNPAATADTAREYLETARKEMYRMRNAGELITVVTGFQTYENMAIKSLSFSIDPTVSFGFTAVLVQVQTVALKTARIPTTSEAKTKHKENEGKKPYGPQDYSSTAVKIKEGGVDGFKTYMGNLFNGSGPLL